MERAAVSAATADKSEDSTGRFEAADAAEIAAERDAGRADGEPEGSRGKAEASDNNEGITGRFEAAEAAAIDAESDGGKAAGEPEESER